MRNNTGYDCIKINYQDIINHKYYMTVWQPAGHEKNWKPNIGDYYYGLNSAGDIEVKEYFINPLCEWDIKTGNYARTEQEMIDYKRFLIIDRKVRDIADELGRPTDEDWKDYNKYIYTLRYNYITLKIELKNTDHYYNSSEIYCLDGMLFLRTCLDRIGQTDLEFWAKYASR